MPNKEILTCNLVRLVRDLMDHAYICSLLQERRVITQENTENILAKVTSCEKSRALIDLIRCRFTRAFPWLCIALQRTHQLELLDILDPTREVRSTGESQRRQSTGESHPEPLQLKQSTLETQLELDQQRQSTGELHQSQSIPEPDPIQQTQTMCCICLDTAPCMLFTPCHHMVTCIQCANQVDLCPVCRHLIHNKLQVFT